MELLPHIWGIHAPRMRIILRFSCSNGKRRINCSYLCKAKPYATCTFPLCLGMLTPGEFVQNGRSDTNHSFHSMWVSKRATRQGQPRHTSVLED